RLSLPQTFEVGEVGGRRLCSRRLLRRVRRAVPGHKLLAQVCLGALPGGFLLSQPIQLAELAWREYRPGARLLLGLLCLPLQLVGLRAPSQPLRLDRLREQLVRFGEFAVRARR